MAPWARGGDSGAKVCAGSSQPGSAPTAVRSGSGDFAARAGQLLKRFKVSSRRDPAACLQLLGHPQRGPSLWRPVPYCAQASLSPPRRFFPGSLELHGVPCLCLGPGGHARVPSACRGPCTQSPNSRARPPPCDGAPPRPWDLGALSQCPAYRPRMGVVFLAYSEGFSYL